MASHGTSRRVMKAEPAAVCFGRLTGAVERGSITEEAELERDVEGCL